MDLEMNLVGEKMVALSVAILLLIGSVVGTYLLIEKVDEVYERYDHRFDITLENNGTESYVLLPVPVLRESDSESDSDEILHVSQIVEDLHVARGHGDFVIETSDHGPVLNVTFTDHITLEAEKKFEERVPNPYKFDNLSLERWEFVDDKPAYRFSKYYSSHRNLTLEYDFEVRYNMEFIGRAHISAHRLHMSTGLEKGWNEERISERGFDT